MHQMTNDQFELPFEGRGEAPRVERSGEALHSPRSNERSENDDRLLMEQVVERGNMLRALKRVRRNKGSPGMDGMTVEAIVPFLRGNWERIKEQLLGGRYQPLPVERCEIPKPGGGTRGLGIPTVLDRLIQQAVLQVLQPIFDPTFSDHSYGFRPKRSAHDAVCQAQRYVQSGRRWVVDVDLSKFFDTVSHDKLMHRLRRRIRDARMLRLIRRYLTSGVMVNGVVQERSEGTPQGGPLSPLLANVLLDDVDKGLERRGHKFARYADDCNVYVKSKRAGERVMQYLVKVFAKLRLRINEEKSAVARVWVRKFLGYSFWVAPGQLIKRRVAPKALEAMKERIRQITNRSGGRSIAQVVKELRSYLVGWRSYFHLADTPAVFEDVDKWLRRRLRALHLKHWKHGRKVFGELTKRGISQQVAAAASSHCKRWWLTAKHKALLIALPTAYFDYLGLPRLCPRNS
jgi:RNA-directed DNA polymerase